MSELNPLDTIPSAESLDEAQFQNQERHRIPPRTTQDMRARAALFQREIREIFRGHPNQVDQPNPNNPMRQHQLPVARPIQGPPQNPMRQHQPPVARPIQRPPPPEQGSILPPINPPRRGGSLAMLSLLPQALELPSAYSLSGW